MNHDDFRLKRPERPILDERDFDPSGGDLDAKSAWKTLAGKTLVEAYELFVTNPFHYQEDYMWMGSRAFDYYFPVVDEYLRSVTTEDEWDDCQANILGGCIDSQLTLEGDWPSTETQREIAELTDFVLDNLGRFALTAKMQRGIERSWRRVQAKLQSGPSAGG